MSETPPGNPLAKMREAFPAHHISKLPKETKAQADERKANRAVGVKCEVCGGWHHRNAVHLDYVGHAALTDRLLDTDMEWTWEPLAFNDDGLPTFDRNGGLWIKLSVQGVTRMGYGSADGKNGGDAVKEIIGDALRNAAMRFGAALDLWHKGDLHLDNDPEQAGDKEDQKPEDAKDRKRPAARQKLDGEHTSATALRKAVNEMAIAVRAAVSEKEVNAIMRLGSGTVRQAEAEWPDLLNGQPDLPEDIGLKGIVADRRKWLQNSPGTRLAAVMRQDAQTVEKLGNWFTVNEDTINGLDDVHRDIFDKLHGEYEAELEQKEAA